MLETGRAQDGRRRGYRDLQRLIAGLEDPVVMGQALLIVTGLLTVCGAVALRMDRHAWLSLAVVSTVMVTAVGLSTLLDWRRLPQPMLLLFPALVFLAFVALSIGQHALFAPLSGFFTLCYGYAGLTQKPRNSVLMIPISSLALVCVYGGLNSPVAVRLVVATSVWVILAEVLAKFTARHRSMTEALQRAAYLDALTGLPNRRDLDKQLTLTTAGTSVILIDLDHFKQLNDTHGHSAGDHVLADFGNTVRAVLRERDYCARYGGEEFVLLLPDTESNGAEHAMNRLQQRWGLLHPTVTFSAGTAQHHSDRDPAATLTAADHALYQAKAAGRNTTRHETRHSHRATAT